MAVSNIEVKKINRQSVIRALLNKDVVSRNELAQTLGLSVPTVSRAIQDLLDTGLVEETGTLDSIGGRKAMGYRFLKNAKVAVGVDITRNHINLVIIDLALNEIYFDRLRLKLTDDPAAYDSLCNEVERAIFAAGIRQDEVLGVGFSMPGIVDDDGRIIHALHEEMQLSRDFYQIMSDRLRYEVVLDNDANSAGRAEVLKHNLKEDTVFFFVSPSVGGCVYQHGDFMTGQRFRAGEFGHMTLRPGGKLCYCGLRGCVDAYCSTQNLSQYTESRLDAFFAGLTVGNPELMAVWDRYLNDLTLALHNILTCFDTNIWIVGYLGQFIGPYMGDLRRRLHAYNPRFEGEELIRHGTLKYDASAYGVAARFVEAYIKTL